MQAIMKIGYYFYRIHPTDLLTDLDDKSIVQNDNNSCQMEALYDTAESTKGIQNRNECESAGDGTFMRRVASDN